MLVWGNFVQYFVVDPKRWFGIIIVGETRMRFSLRYLANPVKITAFTGRHYCNHAWLSSLLLESCGTRSAKNGTLPFPRQ